MVFWWDISGKLDGPVIRKEENAHDVASTPEIVVQITGQLDIIQRSSGSAWRLMTIY